MIDQMERRLVLAVFPFTRGFGYVLFEGPQKPVDWGIKQIKEGDKNVGSLSKFSQLVGWYRPDTTVFEDYRGLGSRRARRIENLIDSMTGLAKRQQVETRRYSRDMIRQCFSVKGASTKREIAEVIAKRFPELGIRLPAERKIWMSEDPRMSMFDAAALALTFFHMTNRENRRAA